MVDYWWDSRRRAECGGGVNLVLVSIFKLMKEEDVWLHELCVRDLPCTISIAPIVAERKFPLTKTRTASPSSISWKQKGFSRRTRRKGKTITSRPRGMPFSMRRAIRNR